MVSPAPDLTASRPWAELGPITDLNVLNTGMELLGLLAVEHAAGVGVGLRRERIWLDDGHLVLRDPPGGRPASDVFAAGVLLLERMLQRALPSELAPHRLIPYLNALIGPLPPSVPSLLEELLTPDQALRPKNAIGPYREWAAAAAHEDIRYRAAPRYRGSWEVAGDTHVGKAKMLGRQTNQDALWFAVADNTALCIVADGISESQVGSGDMASRIAVDAVRAQWNEGKLPLSKGGQELLTELLSHANAAIVERCLAIARGDLRGKVPMGTTATIALCRGDQVELAAVGDSRAYLVSPVGAGVLTSDQNGRLKSLRKGLPIDERTGDALTGYLGHADKDNKPKLLPVAYRKVRMLPGETLVLCTDGITDYAAQPHLAFVRMLRDSAQTAAPQELANQLVRLANGNGGGDNATVAVARLTESEG